MLVTSRATFIRCYIHLASCSEKLRIQIQSFLIGLKHSRVKLLTLLISLFSWSETIELWFFHRLQPLCILILFMHILSYLDCHPYVMESRSYVIIPMYTLKVIFTGTPSFISRTWRGWRSYCQTSWPTSRYRSLASTTWTFSGALTRLKLCTRSCLNSCQTSTHVLQRTDRPESYMMGIISSCDQVYKQSTGAWFGTYRERDIDQIPLWHSTHCCTYCTHKVLGKISDVQFLRVFELFAKLCLLTKEMSWLGRGRIYRGVAAASSELEFCHDVLLDLF